MSLDDLTKKMFDLAVPAKRMPGLTFPTALERTYGVLIGKHLGVSDAELMINLLGDGPSSTDHMVLGRAFAAAMLRSSGNAYAAADVIDTLKEYSGREVPTEVARLLGVLGQYAVRSGDLRAPTEEEQAAENLQ